MEERKPPSEHLLEVAFLVLDHALATVRRGRVLVPFVLVAVREMHRFAAKTLEASQDAARAGARRCALAYDGYLTIEGHRGEAVYLEAYEAGCAESVVLAQRYEPRRGSRAFRSIGSPDQGGRTGPLIPPRERAEKVGRGRE